MNWHKGLKMAQVNRPLLVAITGGIASGKSVVSKWFEKKGQRVIYSDVLGHKVLEDEKVIALLSEKFGVEIILDGKIDRKILGKVVFGNSENLKFLNKIMHPKIRFQMKKIAENSSKKYLFYEIPLLYEDNLADKFDLVINVFSSKSTKIKRMQERDDINLEDAEKRIASQLPDYLKKEKADINIINDSDLENVFRQLEAIIKYLPKFKKKNVKEMV